MVAPILTKKHYTDEQVNEKFLELMPLIQKTARLSFSTYDTERREEAVQSVLVTAFQMLKQLAEQGRIEDAFATPLAKYAIGRYREGRPGGVSSCSNDVTSERCRWLGRSTIKNWGIATNITDSFESEATATDSRYSVSKQVAFKIDFFTWLKTQSLRDQQIVRDLAYGETTNDVSRKHGVSAARISQLRKYFEKSWYSYINPKEETDFLEELRELAEVA